MSTPETVAKFASYAYGTTLYHVTAKNADGTPARARVNGAIKLWKRSPEKFSLPMKHGLRSCFYITHHNCDEWVES